MALVPERETIRQRHKRETRIAVLGAARILFSEHGFENTTIRAIAKKAGVGFGTVFNYFPDKSSLLIAALMDDLKDVQSEALKSCSIHSSSLDKFLYLSEQFYAYYSKNISLSRILVKQMLFVEGEWGVELKAQYIQYLEILAKFINDDMKNSKSLKSRKSMLIAECLFSNYYTVLLMGLSSDSFDIDALMYKLKMMSIVVIGD